MSARTAIAAVATRAAAVLAIRARRQAKRTARESRTSGTRPPRLIVTGDGLSEADSARVSDAILAVSEPHLTTAMREHAEQVLREAVDEVGRHEGARS